MPEPSSTALSNRASDISSLARSANGDHAGDEQNGAVSTTPSSPIELLKAVKEVQERRVNVWREYEDAFETFLRTNTTTGASSPAASRHRGPVNGSQNIHNGLTDEDSDRLSGQMNGEVPTTAGSADGGSGRCAGCSSTDVPFSEDLLSQIMQITTQALIECSHRLRTIQTELRHTSQPHLARLLDQIQDQENRLLRSIVERDQSRRVFHLRTANLQNQDQDQDRTGGDRDDINDSSSEDTTTHTHEAQLNRSREQISSIRSDLNDLMQEIQAELVELQIAQP